MAITPDSWLANIFEYPVFLVESPAGLSDWGAELKQHTVQQTRALYYVKLPTGQVDAARNFIQQGFYPVEVNITFELRKDAPALTSAVSDLTVRDDQEFYADAARIAGSCFRYSRFHADPLIPKALADRVKAEWVRSYVEKKRGDALMVAVKNGAAAGFLAAAVVNDGVRKNAVIELIGVDAAFQGQGVGKTLVQEFIRAYRAKCDALRVGTQAANIPSMRLYERLGFSIVETKYVLHLHQ
ncbi:GNAT family N-acetyltransferase [Candidatus Uhrbacteria bacterium]|nr:GNAT family N-acetyltransferase [Candidatus Uhrbacteria bacterium]